MPGGEPALVPPEVRLVDSDAEAEECRAVLAAEECLALDCEGVRLSRFGQLSLVQLGTRGGQCYLFDVLRCPTDSPLVRALAQLLESPAITKVIHDCRMDSDALSHLLGIRLARVHDTQLYAGDGLGLNAALARYHLPLNPVHDTTVYQSNPAFWATRPLTAEMVQWASQDVAVLFALYDRQRAAPPQSPERMARLTEKRLAVCRDGVVHEFRLRRDMLGTFIGRQGSSLRALEEENGVKFQASPTDPEQWVVYAPDPATVRVLMLEIGPLLARRRAKD